MYGGSDEYELTDICKYPEVTSNTWFGEWTERQRQEYFTKFNELTVEDVIQHKAICIEKTSYKERILMSKSSKRCQV